MMAVCAGVAVTLLRFGGVYCGAATFAGPCLLAARVWTPLSLLRPSELIDSLRFVLLLRSGLLFGLIVSAPCLAFRNLASC